MVDHRPLLKIFEDGSLDQISNAQLRNLKEKTLHYCFKMVHIPGVSDAGPNQLCEWLLVEQQLSPSKPLPCHPMIVGHHHVCLQRVERELKVQGIVENCGCWRYHHPINVSWMEVCHQWQCWAVTLKK